jgi:polyisoprenoid-binding protein YceI
VPQGKLAVLELDPAKTTIAYSLEGWPHHTQGTFALKHGVIRLYPRTRKMDGIIIVDAASGNSGHSVRDDRMKSSVLEVSRFPDISFAPQQVVTATYRENSRSRCAAACCCTEPNMTLPSKLWSTVTGTT